MLGMELQSQKLNFQSSHTSWIQQRGRKFSSTQKGYACHRARGCCDLHCQISKGWSPISISHESKYLILLLANNTDMFQGWRGVCALWLWRWNSRKFPIRIEEPTSWQTQDVVSYRVKQLDPFEIERVGIPVGKWYQSISILINVQPYWHRYKGRNAGQYLSILPSSDGSEIWSVQPDTISSILTSCQTR